MKPWWRQRTFWAAATAVAAFLTAGANPDWQEELTAFGGLVAALAAMVARAGGVGAAQELAGAAAPAEEEIESG